MPYTAEISRANPTCFLVLVDQSKSMREPFGGQAGKSKAEGVADAINRLLQNLAIKAAKSEGVRDYFHVGVLGYGGAAVGPALAGPLAKQPLVPISTLANNPLRIEERTRKVDDGAGGLLDQVFKFPVWFEAHGAGRTPMCQALTMAREYVQVFLGCHPTCYPPLILNLTDGKPSDGDPREAAKELRALASADGQVLLFNAHMSSTQAPPILYPASETGFPDDFARLLFRISSPLPPRLIEASQGEGFLTGPGSRGFVFNADLVSVIRFLDIGTRMAQTLH
jgi:hypothetical protein